jgi:DnaJ homolog subfamily C member 19
VFTLVYEQWTGQIYSNMTSVVAIGVGVAAAAFLVSTSDIPFKEKKLTYSRQGRAGLVAMRKYRGGAGALGALGKAYYKGGFEPKMTRKEASLILQLK